MLCCELTAWFTQPPPKNMNKYIYAGLHHLHLDTDQYIRPSAVLSWQFVRCSWSNITKDKQKDASLLFCCLISSRNRSPSSSNHMGALWAVGLPPNHRANQSPPQNWGLPLLLSSCGDFATYYCLSSWQWWKASQLMCWPPVQLHQATLWNDPG